jgi:hypothetical protein
VPELASAVSGRIYKFPANALNVKSLSLTFDASPRYDLEVYVRDQIRPSLRFSGPIGLDGLYRKSEPTASGTFATKGKWLNGSTFEMERQVVGMDELQKLALSFDGDRLHVRAKDRDGREVSIEGEPGP